MRIGIIGAGNIGGTLAGKFVAAGHEVKLAASKGPESIREKAGQIGATAVAVEDTVKDVDVIILSVPFAKIRDVAGLFADVPAGVTVIDTSNYYPKRDGRVAEVDQGKVESVWSSEQLGRPVIKAFNALTAGTLAKKGTPPGSPSRLAIPVAGDDKAGKELAQKLVDEAGFDALDAGALADSWRQQPGNPAYCTELSKEALVKALAAADRTGAPRNRDIVIEEVMQRDQPPSNDELVKRNREITGLG